MSKKLERSGKFYWLNASICFISFSFQNPTRRRGWIWSRRLWQSCNRQLLQLHWNTLPVFISAIFTCMIKWSNKFKSCRNYNWAAVEQNCKYAVTSRWRVMTLNLRDLSVHGSWKDFSAFHEVSRIVYFVRTEVATAKMSSVIFWVVTPCRFVSYYHIKDGGYTLLRRWLLPTKLRGLKIRQINVEYSLLAKPISVRKIHYLEQ